VADFLEDGLAALLDAGLALADAVLAVFAVDLDFALVAAAFAAVFLVSFFALVVFFVDGFFTVAAFLEAAGAFFGAADFLAVMAFRLSARALVLPVVAFFAEVGLVVSTAFLVDVPFLEGGLVFSLVSAGALGRLGASLTLPDGPLGKTNVSFSAPRVSAKLS